MTVLGIELEIEWANHCATAPHSAPQRPIVIMLDFKVVMSFALAQVTWYKDNREVTNDSKYSTSLSFGVCSLEIVSCSVDDAGKYMCVATNSSGKSETSCRIIVNGNTSLLIYLLKLLTY